MSRLMNDLNRVSRSREVDNDVIAVDSEKTVTAKPAPIASNTKLVYFIGILMAGVVGLSAFTVTLSLKTLKRLEDLETTTASTNQKIAKWVEETGKTARLLANDSKKQRNDMITLNTLVERQNEEVLGRINEVKTQAKELETAVYKQEENLADLKYEQDNFKAIMENSVKKLNTSQALLRKEYMELNNTFKAEIDRNAYFPSIEKGIN